MEIELRRKIYNELVKVIDPELAVSIMDLDLVDDVEINGSAVKVRLHLTSPFCPPAFVLKIAKDVHDNLLSIDGIDDVNLKVTGHYMAEYINDIINTNKNKKES